ncbi:MAG: hypothetical protein LBQ15_05410 [Clostridium sp.]|jgi:hypothetical protein|nr:hypothetical protein [Clostridium sp.]
MDGEPGGLDTTISTVEKMRKDRKRLDDEDRKRMESMMKSRAKVITFCVPK